MNSKKRLMQFTAWIAGVGIFLLIVFIYSGALSNGQRDTESDWDFHFESSAHSGIHLEGGEDIPMNAQKIYPVENNGKLILSVSGSDVEVKTWDSGKVRIQWVNLRAGREPKDYHVMSKVEGNTVTVIGKRKSSFFSWNNDRIKFFIMMPKNFNPDVGTSGGDVSMREVVGKVNLESSGGDLNLDKITGDVHLETSGGDIIAKEIDGSVFAETSGGDINLERVTGNVNAETSGGDIIASMLSDSVNVRCETSGGDITLYVPETAKANLNASTSGGSVHLKLKNNFQGKIEADEVVGTINGGGSKVYAETSGGDIRILNQ